MCCLVFLAQVANDDLCVNLEAAYDLTPEEYDEVRFLLFVRMCE